MGCGGGTHNSIPSRAGFSAKNFRITFCSGGCSFATCKMSRFFAGGGDRSSSFIALSEMQRLLRSLLLDFFSTPGGQVSGSGG